MKVHYRSTCDIVALGAIRVPKLWLCSAVVLSLTGDSNIRLFTRFHGQQTRQSYSLLGVRHTKKRRLGQRWYRSRHQRVCCRDDPTSMGRQAYPNATELLISADRGGSNGSRVRLWKQELLDLATGT